MPISKASFMELETHPCNVLTQAGGKAAPPAHTQVVPPEEEGAQEGGPW